MVRARPPDGRGRAWPGRRLWTQCPRLSGCTVTSGCVAGHGGMGPGGRCASAAREPRGEPVGLGRSCGGARAAVVRLGTRVRAEALVLIHSLLPSASHRVCWGLLDLGGSGDSSITSHSTEALEKAALRTGKHRCHSPESRLWSWALETNLYRSIAC